MKRAAIAALAVLSGGAVLQHALFAPARVASRLAEAVREGAPAPEGCSTKPGPDAGVGAYIAVIPHGARYDAAQGWLLWKAAHSDDDMEWDEFLERFDEGPATATALDRVRAMDPVADYRPVLVPALARTWALSEQGRLAVDDHGRETALRELVSQACPGI